MVGEILTSVDPGVIVTIEDVVKGALPDLETDCATPTVTTGLRATEVVSQPLLRKGNERYANRKQPLRRTNS